MIGLMTPILFGGAAAITIASGGAAMITETTSVTMSIFLGGVAIISTVGVWLGTKAVQLAVRLEQGNGRMDKLETRLQTVEKALDKVVN